MMISEPVRRLLRPPLRPLLAQRENLRLRRVPPIACALAGLGQADESAIAAMFSSPRSDREWRDAAPRLHALGITDQSGGVNPGDRRAIYLLVRHLDIATVLEIGTHIGASTSHIAEALRVRSAESGRPGEFDLTTVDKVDVNDDHRKPWAGFGATHSPAELMRLLACEASVHFVARRSLEFMSDCTKRYGLIFLDGDHSAHTVYQEIPAALRLLDEGGLILLHDYFPHLKPLWAGLPIARGPWLAAERLRREGAAIRVIPLGALPWPTKRGSTLTSLALLAKDTSTQSQRM